MTGMAWAGRLGIVIAIIVIERASPALAWFLVALAATGSLCAFVYNGRFLPAPVLHLVDRGLGKRVAGGRRIDRRGQAAGWNPPAGHVKHRGKRRFVNHGTEDRGAVKAYFMPACDAEPVRWPPARR